MSSVKSLFKKLNFMLFGESERFEVPEAFERNPVNPQFGHISDHLNYAAWDEELKLFYLDTVTTGKSTSPALGFVVEINMLTGADHDTMKRLSSVFTTMPKNTCVQVSLLASPNIELHLQKYRDIQGTHLTDPNRTELFKFLAEKRVDFWKKGTTHTLFPGNPMRFREYRACISVVFPDVDLTSEFEVEQLLNTKQGLIASLQASNLFLREWTPDDLIRWTRDLLNPERMLGTLNRDLDSWDPDRPIREQLVLPSTYLHVTDNGKEINFGQPETNNAITVRNYSVCQYPKSAELAEMGGIIGHPVMNNLNYSCPFLVTLNVYKEDFEATRSKVTLKAARATSNASSQMARILPEYARKAEDWQIALDAFSDGGGGTLRILHQLTLFDYAEKVNISERESEAIWHANGGGYLLAPDQYLQLPSFLSVLPMSMDREMLKEMEEFKRLTTKTTTNVVSTMPIVTEWAGMGQPVINLFGRNGQAMGFDLFANPSGNYNAVVTGTSGSGKSFFINDLVRNYLGAGAQVWVIDIGRSYQKLCEFLGGQYIEFDLSSNIVINPFDLVDNFVEDLNILKQMFSLMISPNEPLSDYQMAGLERCIQHCWNEKGPRAQIDDLQFALLHYRNLRGAVDDEITRLGEQIHPFTTNGVHGKWFHGQTTLNFTNELVVLELEELKSKPDLQAVIMRFILFRITTSMYQSRKREKVVVIDEAWDLLDDSNPTSGKFIEGGYRRARKYRGGFLTGTQSVKDYLVSPASRAALNNSDWIFMLRGKKESIEALKTVVQVTPHMEQLILSLSTQTGQYSDVFVYVAGNYGVGRLVSDPFNALLASSRGEDFEAIKNMQNQGLSIGQAVEAVLIERGIAIN